MTSTLTALHAAALADPDAVPPGVLLDALEEDGSRADYVAACREFAAKCREKRRYKPHTAWTRTAGWGISSAVVRRAVAGWREWLTTPGGEWYQANRKTKDFGQYIDTARHLAGMNWHRLLPSLWVSLAGSDRWRRRGSKIEVDKWEVDRTRRQPWGELNRFRVTLTFRDGWVSRAEFRDWQSAEALLPAILANQPFAEAGIAGQPTIHRSSPSYPTFERSQIGPAYDLIASSPEETERFVGGVVVFRPGPNNDAAARARLALSRALRQWATQEDRAGIPSPPA